MGLDPVVDVPRTTVMVKAALDHVCNQLGGMAQHQLAPVQPLSETLQLEAYHVA
jgi:hypothetical protein